MSLTHCVNVAPTEHGTDSSGSFMSDNGDDSGDGSDNDENSAVTSDMDSCSQAEINSCGRSDIFR